MNTPCSVKLLESALDGNLPEEDEAALHCHLEECEACSTALEQMAGGQGWCREAVTLLLRDKLDMAAPTRDTWSEVDFTVEHLEPADEPNMLGRLGGYDVLEIIGHGGMGVVLKGFDRELKRSVAIKVLAPHLAQNSLARKRFAREAQAAAAVVHPHVLAIHQVQPGGRLPFLVMPLVAGESLADRLKTKGMLELKEILRIGMQAAAGLAAAHEQGLVHRDVKPANILLERGVERAVLTDFGLARAADDVTLTRWGIIAGTPQYMSPEQARGEPLDARSDLFSLGCVLYEMATGVSPFRTDSVMATMRRLIDDSPHSIASLNPELPTWFIAIVDCLLEKDPARRFASAKEVSELLEGCLAHVQQPAGVPLPAALAPFVARCESPRAAGRTPAPSSGWRSPRFVSVVALAAVFAFGLFGILLKQATDPPDIAGQWAGDEWGQVVLIKISDSEYKGTYSDTIGKRPGEIRLKWSRIERRFNGTWREGDDRFGELSVRLLDYEIRGALTTDAKSKINPATPRLADLTWTKGATNATQDAAAASKYPYEGVTTLVHSVHVEMRYFEMPDSSPLDVTKLDLATLEKKPGVNVLFTPAVVAISGQEANIQEAHRLSADANIAPMLTGITARVRPTLDGETVHYSLSVRVRLTPYDVDRATFQESVHNGDAQLDRPVIVDIGKGETGRRLLARMVFLRSGTAPSGIALGTLPVMKPGITVPALVIQAEIRFVELPEDLPFDSDKAEAGELDLAEIRKLPRVRVLAEPTLLINNGRDCLFRLGGDIGGFHPGPGIMGRLTVLLDGQMAHYTINLSIRLQQTTDGIARMTDHELTNFGEARLDQLRIVDIGKGPDNRRYLAWIVFRRGPTISSPPIAVPAQPNLSSSLVPAPYTGTTGVFTTAGTVPTVVKKPSFGPVVEAVLPTSAPGRPVYFQFQKGKVFVVGHGLDTTAEGIRDDWKTIGEAGGVDISCGDVDNGLQLCLEGNGSAFFGNVKDLNWDTATAEDVVNRIKIPRQPPGLLGLKSKTFPITNLFMTWAGEVGVMQVLGITDEPHRNDQGKGPAINFRFKLVKNHDIRPAAAKTFSLRHRLAGDMVKELGQILDGATGHSARASADDQDVIVLAPPDVTTRVQTFIPVMDWPDRVTRQPNYEYTRDTELRAMRSFFYACAIQDVPAVFSKLLSPFVLAHLKGDTKTNVYDEYLLTGTIDPEWEKSLRSDWPGKNEAIQCFVREWNRYPLKRLTDDGGISVSFGIQHFCTASFEGAPEAFYRLSVRPDGTKLGVDGAKSFCFSDLPPWSKAGVAPKLANEVDSEKPITNLLVVKREVAAVAKKLQELNPGFDGKVTPGFENGVVTGLSFVTDSVTDISPIQVFVGLRRLDCRGSGRRGESTLSDLSPLKGLPLTMLACPLTRVPDLSSLRGMPLTKLTCDSTHVSDLSPLKGMKLTYLSCSQTQVSDLSPLKGMPLCELYCGGSKVTDLSALGGIPLSYLRCDGTQVSDLSPLQQCTSLKYLNVSHTQVTQAGVAALQKALPSCNIDWDNPASSARIYKALDEPTEIECRDLPLTDLLEYLEQRHHVTIKLDETALKQANVDIDSPLSGNIVNTPLKDALQTLLAPFKLTFIVKDGALLITTEAEANKR